MAQTGFTPIQLYYSSTTTNAPTAGNLAYGELAINITDGKLFYKDNGNAIQVIGWKTVPATAGGTGQTSYAVGDLLYANTTTTLAKLADVATGNALISGGVGVAPSWGKIGLTTHVSGTLPTANGGTNLTSFTANGVMYASSSSALATGSSLVFDGTNLGVGTSSPNVTVHVSGNPAVLAIGSTGSSDPRLDFYDQSAITIAGTLFFDQSDDNICLLRTASGFATDGFRVDPSGYVLVGYTASNGAYRLQVNSQIFATSATIATSDGRYKKDIQPLDGALDLVAQLNPVQFSWKQHPVHNFDTSTPTVGFIAQEIQQVLADKPYLNSIIKGNECTIEPEKKDDDGNVIKEAVKEEFLGIAEGNMIPLLTKALQELNTKFEEYKAAHP